MSFVNVFKMGPNYPRDLALVRHVRLLGDRQRVDVGAQRDRAPRRVDGQLTRAADRRDDPRAATQTAPDLNAAIAEAREPLDDELGRAVLRERDLGHAVERVPPRRHPRHRGDLRHHDCVWARRLVRGEPAGGSAGRQYMYVSPPTKASITVSSRCGGGDPRRAARRPRCGTAFGVSGRPQIIGRLSLRSHSWGGCLSKIKS